MSPTSPPSALELPPPGSRYDPSSDAAEQLQGALAALHRALDAAAAAKRWAGWAAVLAALLATLGFTTFSPGSRIGKLEARVDSLEWRSSATLQEVRDVKFILCAQAQPTGALAAERCATRRAP
ncbi:MAG: hypothetical protein ACTHU0_39500 [Kofleriaceae bacterium]